LIFSHKFWRIARRLHKKNLQQPKITDLDLSDSDLFNLDIGKRGGDFFLGYYSKEGVKLALEKYGVYAELKNRGFDNVITEIDTSDLYKHKISIFHEKKSQQNLLIEVVLRKSYFKMDLPFQSKLNGKCFRCLTIDWFSMQNPRAEFTPRRPRLPGQKNPGLGMSIIALELLMIICWRLNLAGLMNFPGHYHNAFLYSKIFYYLDPVAQAKYLALKKAFKTFPLDKISWGIDWGCVKDMKSDSTFTWMVSEQIIPVDERLKKLFTGKKYKKYVNDKIKEFKFSFDETKYQEIKKKISVTSMERII
jgi:hypothetical protein